jgi:hypothetical protein
MEAIDSFPCDEISAMNIMKYLSLCDKKAAMYIINHFLFFIHVYNHALHVSIIFLLGVEHSCGMVVLDTVRKWVKTWFFDIESQEEYEVSQNGFYIWLDLQVNDKQVLTHLVEGIKVWIKNQLSKHDRQWLNYVRLSVPGMDQRTSSVGEALHWSMKSGFDGVQSSMAPETAAVKMVTKANQKGKSVERHNAEQASRTKVWTSTQTQQYLTDYCARKTETEWNLAPQYKVVQIAKDHYLVYRRDSDDVVGKPELNNVKYNKPCFLFPNNKDDLILSVPHPSIIHLLYVVPTSISIIDYMPSHVIDRTQTIIVCIACLPSHTISSHTS